jgi:hypothetical protein
MGARWVGGWRYVECVFCCRKSGPEEVAVERMVSSLGINMPVWLLLLLLVPWPVSHTPP